VKLSTVSGFLAARVLGLVVAARGQRSHAGNAHERHGCEVGVVRDRHRLHEWLACAVHDAGEKTAPGSALSRFPRRRSRRAGRRRGFVDELAPTALLPSTAPALLA